MSNNHDFLERLKAVGTAADSDIDLGDTALILAALDRPDDCVEDYRQHMATLANETAAAAKDAVGLEQRIEAIRNVLFVTHGYGGDSDTYDDMQNANLMSVIDRRKGLPVALGILCIHAARSQGWDMVGMNFPSHFLLQLRSADGAAVVDPFNHAEILDDAALQKRLKIMFGRDMALDSEFCRAVSHREILLRLQNNIRLRALQDGKTERALAIIERMVLLAPARGDLRLEFAVLQAKEGNLLSAIRGLEEFIESAAGTEMKEAAAKLLTSLKAKLN